MVTDEHPEESLSVELLTQRNFEELAFRYDSDPFDLRIVAGPEPGKLPEDLQQIIKDINEGVVVTPARRDSLLRGVMAARPSLLVEDGRARPFRQSASKEFPTWSKLRRRLPKLIPSVVRIDLVGHGRRAGAHATAFLIGYDKLATNCHVAELVEGHKDGAVAIFSDPGSERSVRSVGVAGVIDSSKVLDLAVLRLAETIEDRSPIQTTHLAVSKGDAVVAVGFPLPPKGGRIGRAMFPEGEYEALRVAPGLVTRVDEDLCAHDCTTYGGSSGSPIFDMATGRLVAVQAENTLLFDEYETVYGVNWGVSGSHASSFLASAGRS